MITFEILDTCTNTKFKKEFNNVYAAKSYKSRVEHSKKYMIIMIACLDPEDWEFLQEY